MAAMSPDEAIIKAVYTLLTTSSSLQTALGGTVRLYHTFPDEPEPAFPYLAQTLNVSSDEDDAVRERGVYMLDIWDLFDTKQRISDAVSEIRFLLHRRMVAIPADTVRSCRFFLERGMFIQEEEPNMHRYNMAFAVRWIRNAEIQERLAP
jgi:hypothetical protein